MAKPIFQVWTFDGGYWAYTPGRRNYRSMATACREAARLRRSSGRAANSSCFVVLPLGDDAAQPSQAMLARACAEQRLAEPATVSRDHVWSGPEGMSPPSWWPANTTEDPGAVVSLGNRSYRVSQGWAVAWDYICERSTPPQRTDNQAWHSMRAVLNHRLPASANHLDSGRGDYWAFCEILGRLVSMPEHQRSGAIDAIVACVCA